MASATTGMSSRDFVGAVATKPPGVPTVSSSTAMEKLELLSETAFAAATGAAPPSTSAAAGAALTDNNNSSSNSSTTNNITRTSSGIKSPSGWTIGSSHSNGGGAGTGSGNTSLVNTPVAIHHGFGTAAAASASANRSMSMMSTSLSGGNLLLLDQHQDQDQSNKSPASYLSTRSVNAAVSVPAVLTTTTPMQESEGSSYSNKTATFTDAATRTTADLQLDARTFTNAAAHPNNKSYHGRLKPRVVESTSTSRGAKGNETGSVPNNKDAPKHKDHSSSPTYLYDSNRVVHMASSDSNHKDHGQHGGGGRLPSVVSYPQLQAPSNSSSQRTPTSTTTTTTTGSSGGHHGSSHATMMHHHHQAAASAAFAPPPSATSATQQQQQPQVGLEGSSFTAYQAPTWTSTLSGSTSPLPPQSSSSTTALLQGEEKGNNKMMMKPVQQAVGGTNSPNGTRMTVDVPFHPGSGDPNHPNHHLRQREREHHQHHHHPSMLHLSQSGSFDADTRGHNQRPVPQPLPPHLHPHHHHQHHTDQHGGAPYHHLHHQHHPGHHPHHHHQMHHQPTHNNNRGGGTPVVVTAAAYDELMRENNLLKQQLKEKDIVNSSLQHRVNYLENQIHELRQLPTGKISHIPVDDMIRIMQEYGSEISSQTLPQRKYPIQKASIVRQFRRWNPDFFRYFLHVNGEWVPKLGREGELRRRAEKRREIKQQTANKQK